MAQNKYDQYSGIGNTLKLYENKVYSIVPNNNIFIDENGKRLAERVTLKVTIDSVYKTQYHNKDLAKALLPITESTKIYYYDKDGNEIDTLNCLPELNREYASIICKYPSDPIIDSVSIVIYTDDTLSKIFLNDGSITMSEDYNPTQQKDVATKQYVDTLLESFTSSSRAIKSFTITQNNQIPLKRYYYKDNKLYNILFLRTKDLHTSMEDCKIVVDAFAISRDYNEDTTEIGIVINDKIQYVNTFKNIITGNSSNWKLLDSENIYGFLKISDTYQLNSYSCEFNLNNWENIFNPENPLVIIKVRVQDSTTGLFQESDEYVFGLEEYIGPLEKNNMVFSYIEENLNKYKTKYSSGVSYFPNDKNIIYTLPLSISIGNNYLQYFRSECNAYLKVLNNETKNIYKEYPLYINSHTPTSGTFNFNQKIEFTLNNSSIYLIVYNVRDEEVFNKKFELNLDTDISDESNRVTTSSALFQTPDIDYGLEWNPKKELNEWDPIVRNNVYTSSNENSAICFVVENESLDCYSHININIEHDGEMYILSEGNTRWLDCQKLVDPFKTPKKNLDGCKVNENYFTFGKVTYKSKVFIRILHATKIIFNSAILS